MCFIRVLFSFWGQHVHVCRTMDHESQLELLISRAANFNAYDYFFITLWPVGLTCTCITDTCIT